MKIICATHGHCFDGLASATLFLSWMQERHPAPELQVVGLGYGVKQAKPTQSVLSGDENGLLDFRYEKEDALTYYFDHHGTAFADDSAKADFEARQAAAPLHFVYDAKIKSCTKLLATHLESHGLADMSRFTELVHWADIVDSANFASAEAATDTKNPLLRLVSVVEQFGDDALLNKLATRLSEAPLLEVAESPLITTKFETLGSQYEEYQARVRQVGKLLGRVAFVDLSEKHNSATTKFTQYAEFPTATYSVVLLRLASGFKISAGHNPWANRPCDRDIGALCARFGGGGHQMVGGISFAKDDAAGASLAARTLVEELS